MVRRALLPWYNSFKFFHTYAKVDGWSAEKNFIQGDNITDQWLISKLQTLTKEVTTEMEGYRLYNVVPQLFTFIEDLTNWYIRLNRRRFWDDTLSDDKCSAYSALYSALKEMSKIMAPFAPFLSEHIFLELRSFGENLEESVHLCDYPLYDETKIDTNLEDAVTRMQELILLGRQKRNQTGIKVKTPMASLTVIHQDQQLLDGISKLETYIKSELNIKEIKYSTQEDNYIKLYAKPNSRVLGKRLGKSFGKFMGLIKNIDSKTLKEYEASGEMTLSGEKLTGDDIYVYREPKEGADVLSNRWITIDMDTELTPELINEGLAREVVNRIQRSRKDLNFNVEDRIKLKVNASSNLKDVITFFSEYIKRETLTIDIEFTNDDLVGGIKFDIESDNMEIQIIK
jgi:isoleucyl-tRNA synthetase